MANIHPVLFEPITIAIVCFLLLFAMQSINGWFGRFLLFCVFLGMLLFLIVGVFEGKYQQCAHEGEHGKTIMLSRL